MTEPTLRAGVIGLGTIGGAVAVRLAGHGIPLAVHDVRPGLATALPLVPPSLGSAREVASCSDVVMVAVVTAEQSEDVLVGRNGLLTGEHGGVTVVLLSTVTLEAVRRLDQLCRERGAVLLDAGVTSGGGQAVDDGLVVMLGGADTEVAAAAPVLEAFARSVIHCGPTGAGMVAKLARNAAQYGRWAVMAEAAAIAAAGGVESRRFLQVLEDGADGRDESLTWLRGHEAGFTMSAEQQAQFDILVDKDLAAVQELAAQVGVESALVNLTRPRVPAVTQPPATEPLPENAFERGLVMMGTVMGEHITEMIQRAPRHPVLESTIENLFADIWSRTALPVRDRRLLAIGATAMLGRTDLLTNHLTGAVRAGELTTRQLRELSLFLHYYAGWGNGTAVDGVVEKLIEAQHAAGSDEPNDRLLQRNSP